jgi:ADP-ribosyl-[dinitrogen reductase] hydrolase
MELKERFYGSIIGGIVGDSYGSPYEFKERDTYTITQNMEYNHNFKLEAGSYTDDTSMMMCLMNSLHEKGFDHNDQMEKYHQWRMNGYMSVNGTCFDIGRTCNMAIAEFLLAKRLGTFDPEKYYGLDHELSSGNGSIMRLAPIPIFYHDSEKDVRKYSILSSKVTHGSLECLESAELMGRILFQIFNGTEKKDLFLPIETFKSKKVQDISQASFLNKKRQDIQTTGYVIHTLEAALWSFMNTSNYKDGLYMLAKMGQDVDTVLCVYGQIAGAYYGYHGIPNNLVFELQNQDLLFLLITQFIKVVSKKDLTVNRVNLS